MIPTLCVDDHLLLGGSKLRLNKLKTNLMDQLEMAEMGDVESSRHE